MRVRTEWDWRQETNLDAMVFARVSGPKQERNTSLEYQQREIEQYCKERHLNVIEVVRLVESARKSGDRKQYHQALKLATKKRVKHLIFWVGDRESRNATDLESTDDLIRAGKLVVHHVRYGKVYWQNTPQSEMMSRQLDGLISKDSVERHAIRVNDGTLAKAEAGWWPHCKPVLGYISRRPLGEDGTEMSSGMSKMIPDPNKANIRQVRREFELRAMGFGLIRIRAKVLEEGLVPPHRIKRYNTNSIETRLKHPFYHGTFIWKGKEYQGKHQLIIAKNILKRVKDSWTGRNFLPIPLSINGLFSHWIKCGHKECGMIVVYDPKPRISKKTGEKKVHPYYHCSNSRLVHESLKGMSIREEKILEAFEPSIEGISITESFAQDIITAIKEAEVRTEAAIRKQIEDFKTKRDKLDEKKDQAYEHFVEGILNRDELDRIKAKIKIEQDDTIRQLEEAQVQISVSGLDAVKKILELCINAKSKWKNASNEKRAEYLKTVYSNPILEGGNLRYDYHKPFKVISEMRGNPLWWRLTGSNR